MSTSDMPAACPRIVACRTRSRTWVSFSYLGNITRPVVSVGFVLMCRTACSMECLSGGDLVANMSLCSLEGVGVSFLAGD